MKSKLVQSEKMVESLTQQIDDELAKSSELVRELSAVKTSLDEVRAALVLSEAREQDMSQRYMKVKEDSEAAEKRRLRLIKQHLFKRKASASNVLAEDGKEAEIVDKESQSLDSINVEVSRTEVERELEIKFKEVEEMENSIRGEREAMRAQLEESRATLSSERKRMLEREKQLLGEVGLFFLSAISLSKCTCVHLPFENSSLCEFSCNGVVHDVGWQLYDSPIHMVKVMIE